MNILVYIPVLSQESGGIRQYSVGLLKLLSEDNTNKYFIYHNSNDPEILGIAGQHPHMQLISDAGVNYNDESYLAGRIRRLANQLKTRLGSKKQWQKLSFIDTLCDQYSIDIIHCPYQFIPVTSRARLITTLHDIQEIHFPENFTAEIRAYRANAYLDFVRRADMVMVSYEHVKQDILQYFAVPENKVEILLLKMDQLWFDKYEALSPANITSLKLPGEFLLYPANTWKHKNHLGLLNAVYAAREKHNTIINVVCTGHTTDHYTALSTLVEQLELKEQVFFTGVVDEAVLHALYKSCRGVVIPTLYEAGSFPLYESILMNIPVICSNVTSLPDTMGSDKFIFDPLDQPDLIEKMIALWNNDSFRKDNLQHLRIQAKKIRDNNPLPALQKQYAKLNA